MSKWNLERVLNLTWCYLHIFGAPSFRSSLLPFRRSSNTPLKSTAPVRMNSNRTCGANSTISNSRHALGPPVSLFFFAGFLAAGWPASVSAASQLEGFGAQTPGGANKSVYHVTNLKDSGVGSLRDSLAQGNRHIVFDVAGEILLASDITIKSAFITVDGLNAPSPGITLKNHGLIVRGGAGHDIILQGLRIRNAARDGIWVTDAAYNVVIDHVSVQGSGDGNIDITRAGTRDVTVSWSILGTPAGEEKNMLLAFQPTRISVHHNLFIESRQRNPQITFDDSDLRLQDTETTLDLRNNLIWNWKGGYGSRIRYGARANVVNNFYSYSGGDTADALIICKGLSSDSQCYDDITNTAEAFVSGNYNAQGASLNSRGTETVAFPAAPITPQDAFSSACQIHAQVGVFPRDSIDQNFVSKVALTFCGSAQPTPTPIPKPTATPASTPSPVPPTPGSFFDGFDRADTDVLGNGWTSVLGFGGFSIKSQRLNARSASRILQLGTNLGDVSASARFQRASSNAGINYVLLIRYQDANNYYYCKRKFGGTAAIFVGKVVQGRDVTLLTVSSTGNSTAPFDLECRAQGSVLSVHLNGNPACSRSTPVRCSVEDTSIPTGAVGMQIDGGFLGADFADNFRVK